MTPTLTGPLTFHFYTMDEIHDVAHYINRLRSRATRAEKSWRDIAINTAVVAGRARADLNEANEALERVNGFADNWAGRAHTAEAEAEQLREGNISLSREVDEVLAQRDAWRTSRCEAVTYWQGVVLEVTHELALEIDQWRDNCLDEGEDADAWVDAYLRQCDETQALEYKVAQLYLAKHEVQGERDRILALALEACDQRDVATQENARLRTLINNTAKDNAQLRKDKQAIITALQPWWDSGLTGDSDEDADLIQALPDWAVDVLSED